jgi:hypothetical protein
MNLHIVKFVSIFLEFPVPSARTTVFSVPQYLQFIFQLINGFLSQNTFLLS